ncbi:GNAT family N-acetyltransferase [Granulosicoccus sp. 3-233]|uniref:GNAT family N-acetyltransferase n=1 Tax=Granulosicoccus sp. 3-233 TaxID=3417969 RepID=UPI003D332303
MIEPDTDSLSIQCLQSAEAFEQLRLIWQGLERLDTRCTPFNTWTWNSLWWQHYASPRDTLALLVVREGRRVVAIAPLYLQTARMCRVIPVRVLRFLGSGGDTSPDYLDIIAIPARRDAAERMILQYLPRIPGWQKLLLSDMAESSSLARRAGALAAQLPGVALTPRYHVIQKSALPGSFDDYRAQLSRKRRKQINHRQNRLDAAGRWELSLCASKEDLAEACDALVALHRLRWESKQEAGGFRSAAYEQFHRAIIRQFFADDALWLATLKLDGKIIGVQYIFVWRGELLFMQSGYSPEHENLSPGHVLFTYVIQRGIEQGMTGLDMLKGHYAYKSVYARDETRTVDVAYLRPGVRALMGGARDQLRRRQGLTAVGA